jgi:hypothetical protein
MADFQTKKPKIRNGLDERKTQPNGGLRRKEDTTKIRLTLAKERRNQVADFNERKTQPKNKVDFSERKTQPKWRTFETKEKPNYGICLTKERHNKNGGLWRKKDATKMVDFLNEVITTKYEKDLTKERSNRMADFD